MKKIPTTAAAKLTGALDTFCLTLNISKKTVFLKQKALNHRHFKIIKDKRQRIRDSTGFRVSWNCFGLSVTV